MKIKTIALILFLILFSNYGNAQEVPYTFTNNSTYTDNQIYVAVVGIKDGGHVWINGKNSSVNQMNVNNNTISGPVISGNTGPGANGKYADCFTKLSDIPNKTINIPQIAGCRILISFNSQLYLYFFGFSGTSSGYASPNLANTTDPNQGIRFEMIELTYATNGLWTNTTRVDSYQYPMGLEVWGNNNFYQKVGELKSHDEILAQWKANAPSEFQICLDATKGIIKFPTKNSGFSTTYLDSYINSIWSKYTNAELVFNAGNAGTWKGSVSNSAFVFRRVSDGQTATISRKPTTTEAMEGSGALATGGQWDLVIQAQICAAINRHAIDLNIASGVSQDLSNPSKYYITSPYNWYCKFWHQAGISNDSKTYTFCYDDVFEQSSTINCTSPTKATITIGKVGGTTEPTPDPTVKSTGPVTLYKDCDYLGTAINIPIGDYTLAQLNTLGIIDNDISSLKIPSGYKAILYKDDNFSGSSITITENNNCLVSNNWNDQTTSLKIQPNGVSGMNGTYTLENRESGKYMDVAFDGADADGTNIQQWTKTGGTNQQFTFTDTGNGAYKIISTKTNKAVDIQDNSTADFANIQQWTYFGSDNQKFILIATDNGYYKLKSVHSAKIIEVYNSGTADGININQYSDNGQNCGQWKLNSINSGDENNNDNNNDNNITENCSGSVTTDKTDAGAATTYNYSFTTSENTVKVTVEFPEAKTGLTGWCTVNGVKSTQLYSLNAEYKKLEFSGNYTSGQQLTIQWEIAWAENHMTCKTLNYQVGNNCQTSDLQEKRINSAFYPNPAQDNVFIQTEENATICIYDMLGQIKRNQAVEKGITKINISDFNKAMYIMKINKKNSAESFIFIKK